MDDYKNAKVRMIVEYVVRVPKDYDAHMIEFMRNEGSRCAGNAIQELEDLDEAKGCLCDCTWFECIDPDYVE